MLSHFLDAVDGRFPPADGGVTLLPALPRGLECSVAFTGHAVIATDLPADDVYARGPDGLGASLAPDSLASAQAAGDVLGANGVLVDAYNTDVRPLLREPRKEMGLDPDPMAAGWGD